MFLVVAVGFCRCWLYVSQAVVNSDLEKIDEILAADRGSLVEDQSYVFLVGEKTKSDEKAKPNGFHHFSWSFFHLFPTKEGETH